MKTARIGALDLAYEEQGAGDPLVFIHGLVMCDTGVPLSKEPALAQHRFVRWHRRGYGESTHAPGVVTVGEQAADCAALMRHLGVGKAHVVGHSYGALIGLQLALDAPELVGSLTLLEPALFSAAPGLGAFLEAMAPIPRAYQAGDKRRAIEMFVGALNPEWQASLERNMPPGAAEQAVADSDTTFGVDFGVMVGYPLSEADGARIRCPVALVQGARTLPIFGEALEATRRRLPGATVLTVQATHLMHIDDPRAVAEAVAPFLAANPLPRAAAA